MIEKTEGAGPPVFKRRPRDHPLAARHRQAMARGDPAFKSLGLFKARDPAGALLFTMEDSS